MIFYFGVLVTNFGLLFSASDKVAPYERLKEWHDEVVDRMLPQTAPPVIDYRKVNNPYAALYGTDWEKRMTDEDVYTFKTCTCVKFLVQHMYEHTKAFFEKHPPPPGKQWYFYHDALSLS